MPLLSVPLIFSILALIFGALSLRDYRRNRRLSPAGRTYLRVALIFGVVALLLSL